MKRWLNSEELVLPPLVTLWVAIKLIDGLLAGTVTVAIHELLSPPPRPQRQWGYAPLG